MVHGYMPAALAITGQGRVAATLALLHCRRALTLNQASDVVIRMKAARRPLQEGDDVLSQQPLAAGAHFFSMKSRDPSEQEIVAVPSRTTPAPRPEALSVPRTNVSKTFGNYAAQSLLYAVILSYTRCIRVSYSYRNKRECVAINTNNMLRLCCSSQQHIQLIWHILLVYFCGYINDMSYANIVPCLQQITSSVQGLQSRVVHLTDYSLLAPRKQMMS